MNNSIWLGVGLDILPTEPSYQSIIALNQALSTQTRFAFNPESNPPHLNLYDFNLPQANLAQAEMLGQKIADEFGTISLQVTGIDFFPHGSIFIKFEPSDILNTLEEKVVSALNPLRLDCVTQDYWQPWRIYSETQLQNRDKYGNPHVLDAFIPHLTIGFIRREPEVLRDICNKLSENLDLQMIEFKHLDCMAKEGREIIAKKSFLFEN